MLSRLEMVWLTAVRWFPSQTRWKVSPSRYRKRMLYRRLGAKYHGRARTCFTITIRIAQRALRYTTEARKRRVDTLARLHETRIAAACLEHNMDKNYFLTALAESNIALNRKVLADLSIYEPRTFQSLVHFVKMRSLEIGLQSANLGSPHGLLTRGMMK